MKLDALTDLLEDQIRDSFNGLSQLAKVLPRLMKTAAAGALRDFIEAHLTETELQVERLRKIGEILDIRVAGKRCRSMDGLVAEAKELVQATGSPAIVDAAIVLLFERLKLHEIALFGRAMKLATALGFNDVAKLLNECLDEENAAVEQLEEISSDVIMRASIAEEDDEENPETGRSRTLSLDN